MQLLELEKYYQKMTADFVNFNIFNTTKKGEKEKNELEFVIRKPLL